MCLNAKLCGVGNHCVRAPVVPALNVCGVNIDSIGPCTACGGIGAAAGIDCTSTQLCKNNVCVSPGCVDGVNGPCSSCGASKRNCTVAQLCNFAKNACMNI